MTRIFTHLPADGSVLVISQTDDHGRISGVLRIAIIGWLVISVPTSSESEDTEEADYASGWFTTAEPIFGCGVKPDWLDTPHGTARNGTVLMDDETLVTDEQTELVAYFQRRIDAKG
jgi:hypothetical protein